MIGRGQWESRLQPQQTSDLELSNDYLQIFIVVKENFMLCFSLKSIFRRADTISFSFTLYHISS